MYINVYMHIFVVNNSGFGEWDLAQSVEHATLDVGIVGLGPTLGIEITKEKN